MDPRIMQFAQALGARQQQAPTGPMTGAPTGQYAPNMGAGTPDPGMLDRVMTLMQGLGQRGPSPEKQAAIAKKVEELRKLKMLQEQLRRQEQARKIQESVARGQQTMGQPQTQPQVPGRPDEGGNDNQIQMSPRIIEALRRSGAM